MIAINSLQFPRLQIMVVVQPLVEPIANLPSCLEDWVSPALRLVDPIRGLILDLYAGFGDTTALLAHGLQHAPSAPSAPSARAVLSFEQRRERRRVLSGR